MQYIFNSLNYFPINSECQWRKLTHILWPEKEDYNIQLHLAGKSTQNRHGVPLLAWIDLNPSIDK